MKLDPKYLSWKGTDYFYQILFDKKRFPGFTLLEKVFTEKELDKSAREMTITEKGIQFKAIEQEHGFLFEFGEDVENTIANTIMMELSDELKGQWIKTALTFVEREGEINHLIY